MEKIPQISDAEYSVMQALWEAGEATSSTLVAAVSRSHDWKPKTIQTLLNRLVSKGAVTVERTGGKAFVYRPAISRDAYVARENHHFLDKLYQGSLGLMLSRFVSDTRLSREEIDALKAILEEADR